MQIISSLLHQRCYSKLIYKFAATKMDIKWVKLQKITTGTLSVPKMWCSVHGNCWNFLFAGDFFFNFSKYINTFLRNACSIRDDPHFYRFTSSSKNKLTTLINYFCVFFFRNDRDIFTRFSLLDSCSETQLMYAWLRLNSCELHVKCLRLTSHFVIRPSPSRTHSIAFVHRTSAILIRACDSW